MKKAWRLWCKVSVMLYQEFMKELKETGKNASYAIHR